jgi:hypothetical protein
MVTIAYQSMLQRKLKMTQLAFREGFRKQGYWFLKKGSSLAFSEEVVRPTQTLEFWLRWLPLKGKQALLSAMQGKKVLWQWSLRRDGRMCFAKAGEKGACTSAGLTSRQWTFVALRWPAEKGSPAEVWVGGRKVAEFDRLPSSSSATWQFGAAGELPAFRGGLDEVSLYRVALSPQQLRNHLPFHSALLSLEVPPRLFACSVPRRKWKKEELRSLDSLVLHLRLDRELLNDPRFGTLNKAVDTGLDIGIHQGAVWLNGKSSFLKLQQQASYPQQTLEFWMSPERLQGGVMAAQKDVKTGSWRWQIFFNAQKHLCVLWLDSARHTLCTLKPIPRESWTHIAVTWDVPARQIRLWRGGRLQGQGALLNNTPNGLLWLGVSQKHGHYKGLLDEVALYNKVLPASAILRHAKPSSPLFTGAQQRKIRYSSLQHLLFSLSANLPPKALQQRAPRLKVKNVKYTFGREGGAYRFNGKNSMLSLSESFSSPKQTLMLWVKPEYRGVSGGLLSSQALSPKRQWRWQMFVDGQQRACMLVYDRRSWRVCSRRSLKAGVWSHIAVTLEQKQGRMTLYVNGKADAVGRMKGNTPYGHLVVGYSHNAGYFRGALDSVALFSTVLSPKTISLYARMLRLPRDLYAKEKPILQQGHDPSLFLHLPFRVGVKQHPDLKKRLSLQGLIPDSGIGGQSYFFDGKDDGLVLKKFPLFQQQTLSLWVRPSRRKKQGLVAFQDISGKNNNWNWQLFVNKNNRLCFVFYDNKQRTLCSRSKIPVGLWTHVAMVIDLKKSHQVHLYLRGVLQGSHVVKRLNSRGGLVVGKTRYSAYFRGSLDELLIFDKAMSSASIQELADPKSKLYRRFYAAYLRKP